MAERQPQPIDSSNRPLYTVIDAPGESTPNQVFNDGGLVTLKAEDGAGPTANRLGGQEHGLRGDETLAQQDAALAEQALGYDGTEASTGFEDAGLGDGRGPSSLLLPAVQKWSEGDWNGDGDGLVGVGTEIDLPGDGDLDPPSLDTWEHA